MPDLRTLKLSSSHMFYNLIHITDLVFNLIIHTNIIIRTRNIHAVNYTKF